MNKWMIVKFAFKNIFGSGLRTLLNLIIMGVVFFVILFLQGVYDGFQNRIEKVRIEDETGHSQYWFGEYDPLDPLSLKDNHAKVPASIQSLLKEHEIAQVLAISATLYPQGKMYPVIVKGIKPEQSVLKFPTASLNAKFETIPGIIGQRMAKKLNLKEGDSITMRWRTATGTIDAHDIRITKVFETDAPAIDIRTIWIPLERMQKTLEAKNHSTYIVSSSPGVKLDSDKWHLKTEDDLLSDTRKMMKTERGGATFMYLILLFLAGITILDTQLLSIFRRRKEVGLLLALGFTQQQIVALFSLEGAILGLVSCLGALILGAPFLWYLENHGIHVLNMEQFGMAGGKAIYPYYSISLVITTTAIILGLTTLVSYYPARRIGKLNPVDAIRGNWT